MLLASLLPPGELNATTNATKPLSAILQRVRTMQTLTIRDAAATACALRLWVSVLLTPNMAQGSKRSSRAVTGFKTMKSECATPPVGHSWMTSHALGLASMSRPAKEIEMNEISRQRVWSCSKTTSGVDPGALQVRDNVVGMQSAQLSEGVVVELVGGPKELRKDRG